MPKATICPVEVINDLYDAECVLGKTTAAANAMYEIFFERAYVEHEWDKERYEFLSNMFSVMTDQLFALKKEFGEVLDKYNALHEKGEAA